jgi:hypothetical protein
LLPKTQQWRFYLDVTGVPADQITKALAQVAQEGTSIIQQDKRKDSTLPRELLSPAYPDQHCNVHH